MIEIKCTADNFKIVPIEKIVPNPKNNNRHSIEQINAIAKLIKAHGFREPLTISNRSGFLNCGHARLEAAMTLGMTELPVIYQDFASEAEEYQHMTADNEIARWAELDYQGVYDALKEIPDIDTELLGIDGFKFPDDIDSNKEEKGSLSDNFGVPPFSVLDTKQGYWQNRKRKWLSLGFKSEIGRSVNPKMKIDDLKNEFKTGFDAVCIETSVFDSTLTEIMYRWFSADDDLIVDPFAGGCVRGIVASKTSRKYIGIDLRDEQIESNRSQEHIADQNNVPVWVCGDSLDMPIIIKDTKADMIFSCPPYADLEIYSDDERDISNMPYPQFLKVYRKIIKNCYEILNDNRFACFVIGEVRSKNGEYYNFVGDTIQAFKDSGFKYYNEIILLNQAGTAALRAARPFKSGRKICKTHQNVLVFYKGDWKKASDRLGDVYVPEIEEDLNGVTASE